MSNIVVYTTTKLKESEDFLNNFLDGLLEQYCSTKFVENTVIDSSISLPTLNDLIRFANPGYYYKSPGLYGHMYSTDVKLVYESYLHTELEKALSHKLSRLFIKYNTDKISQFSFVLSDKSYCDPFTYDPYSVTSHRRFKASNQINLKEMSSFYEYYKEDLKSFSELSFELHSFVDKTFHTKYDLLYPLYNIHRKKTFLSN
jgi:hypothetical protein